jgi:hypothetical protein
LLWVAHGADPKEFNSRAKSTLGRKGMQNFLENILGVEKSLQGFKIKTRR